MELSVYSMYDSKAAVYRQPFFAETDATAIRAVLSAMSNPDHEFYRFAEDYSLFLVGTWEQWLGKLVGLEPRSIADCWILKASLKGENHARQE